MRGFYSANARDAAADVAAAEKSHDDLFHAFVRPFLIMQSSYRLRS